MDQMLIFAQENNFYVFGNRTYLRTCFIVLPEYVFVKIYFEIKYWIAIA